MIMIEFFQCTKSDHCEAEAGRGAGVWGTGGVVAGERERKYFSFFIIIYECCLNADFTGYPILGSNEIILRLYRPTGPRNALAN